MLDAVRAADSLRTLLMPGADRLFSLTSKWVNKDAADNLSPHVRSVPSCLVWAWFVYTCMSLTGIFVPTDARPLPGLEYQGVTALAIVCIGHAVSTNIKSMSEDQPAAPWWPSASKNCGITPDPDENNAWGYRGGTVQIQTSLARCSL